MSMTSARAMQLRRRSTLQLDMMWNMAQHSSFLLLLLVVAAFTDTISAAGDGASRSTDSQRPPRSGATVAPTFTSTFADRVVFVNTVGAMLPCTAAGRPAPTVAWIWADSGQPVVAMPRLVEPLGNGSLRFLAFEDAAYSEAIHSAVNLRCQATNDVATVVSKLVRVRAVLLSRYQTFNVRVNDVYVMRGNTAVVKCFVDPYYVRDYVTVKSWTQGSDVLNTGDRFSIMSNGDLHIRDVNSEDSHKPLRCTTYSTLTNDTRTSTDATLYVIDSVNSAPIVKETPSRVVARQGARVELPCVSSAFPLPSYTWSRRGVVLNMTSRVTQVAGNLVLDRTQLDDAGDYVCRTWNQLGSRDVSIRLFVTAPLTVRVRPDVQVVDVGQSATFLCVISGSPAPLVTWYKDGSPADTDDDARVTLSDDRRQLSVRGVLRQDAGVYQCLVENSDDSEQSSGRLIIGAARAYIYRHFNAETFVTVDSKMSLVCVAAGNPPPTITWSLDDAPLTPNDDDDDNNDDKSRYVVVTSVTPDGDVVSYVNVSSVRVADGGTYRCTARNRVGVEAFSGKLFVYGTPVIRPMKNVTAVAGEELVLRCYVSGYPVHSITWKKGESLLPVNHRQRVDTDGMLSVSAINRLSDAGWYTCDARDSTGQGMSRSVYVSVMEPPRIDSFSFPRRKLYDRVSVSCVVSSGDLPISIAWTKDGAGIPYQLGVVVQKTGAYSSLLSIGRADPRLNGNYTCTASNAAATAEFTADLHVHVPPRWKTEPRDSSVVLGHSVVVDCQSDGDPAPVVTWKKDSGQQQRGNYIPVTQSDADGRLRQLRNDSLSLDDATASDAGYYLCHASNGVGADLSKVIQLVVHIPAKFTIAEQNYTARLGDAVAMDCLSQGDRPLSIAWSFNHANIDWQYNTRLKAFYFEPTAGTAAAETAAALMGSRLTIDGARRQDGGLYVCTAQNTYGSDTSNVQLTVVEPPEPPTNILLDGVGSRTLTLSWNVEFDGNSPLTAIVIELGTKRDAVVNSLRPAVKYHIRLFAENDIGISQPSAVLRATTTEEEPSASPREVTAIATGSQILQVSWKSPELLHHNGRLIGYYVGYKRHNSSSPYLYDTVPAAAADGDDSALLRCQLNDLDKYTLYGVHVQAYNAKGAGPRSADYVVMTLEDVPSQPPENVNAMAVTSQSILVLWNPPPSSDQNGVLIGYKILYRVVRDDEDETGQMVLLTDRESHSQKILRLLKFTNYSIQVLARTQVGDGVASVPIYVQTRNDCTCTE